MREDYFKYKDNFKKYKHIRSVNIIGNGLREEKLYTIAIPTFKRQDLLKTALESAIKQVDFSDYEIIIVDNDYENDPSDEIVRICNSCNKVYYFKNENNIGMFGNWNRCIELAKGKYITILNDDDWLSESFLSICELHRRKDVDGLYSIANIIDYRENRERIEGYKFIKGIFKVMSRPEKRLKLFDFYLGNKSGGSLGTVFKTIYLKELGGYNEDYFPSSDYILHSNYCCKHKVIRLNKKLNYYRIQENESCKQETLKKWEYIDNDFREYLIDRIGKNRKLLLCFNKLIQEERIHGMVRYWNYQSDSKTKYIILRKIIFKLIAIKYALNI